MSDNPKPSEDQAPLWRITVDCDPAATRAHKLLRKLHFRTNDGRAWFRTAGSAWTRQLAAMLAKAGLHGRALRDGAKPKPPRALPAPANPELGAERQRAAARERQLMGH